MPSALDDLRAARTSNGAPSARNLIVTVFGDAVLPAGEQTALSVQTLSAALEGFEVNERLVRTSLTRLANDGLLAVERQGRRSQYRVATAALVTFRHADRRIYRGERASWDGAWTTVVVDPDAPTLARSSLRDELAWIGFRPVGPNVWVSPTIEPDAIEPLVDASRHEVSVAVTRAPATIGSAWLAQRAVDVADLAERYRSFDRRFSAFTPEVIGELSGAACFKLRVLLIAAFRRIVLSDPAFPADLLPADWPETQARRTAQTVYAAVASASTQWFETTSGIAVGEPPTTRFEAASTRPIA